MVKPGCLAPDAIITAGAELQNTLLNRNAFSLPVLPLAVIRNTEADKCEVKFSGSVQSFRLPLLLLPEQQRLHWDAIFPLKGDLMLLFRAANLEIACENRVWL